MEKTATAQTVWKKMENKEPIIISGPCSAETELQVLDTAIRLAKTDKVDMLRAGIWKPRTKPGNFEGIGEKGLPWLEKAKDITGLPFTVEVAKATHVEAALKHNVDVIWIGARTTVNPFSVQEVADALKGVNVPVMVKNPINPDLNLWIGGLERIEKAGIKQLGVIHRGFSNFGNTEFRNAPMWHIPIELKRQFPDLPVICDPSHICGRRDTLLDVAQKAIDLDFDGLMLESHIDPDNAWSDAKQQVTPEQLEELLGEIVWRHEAKHKEEFQDALSTYRERINHIDDEVLALLGNRMKVAAEIGKYKKEKDITILQTTRWNEVLEDAVKKGAKMGLTEKFIARFFDAVHIESINRQNRVMNEEE